MITDALTKITLATMLTLNTQFSTFPVQEKVLSSREISLENRYPVPSVSDVFRDNILLNLSYMNGRVTSVRDINWTEIEKPAYFEFSLEPGKTFAFHDDVLPEYKEKVVKTTNAHFNASDGFKTDGYLYGDGVCHLASLLYWVALDAGLEAKAPTSHDFMPIPEISKEYGVSIYNNPYAKGSNAQQNLYITNNKDKPITFKFEYNGTNLQASVVEAN